ncbi:MAG: hypothetical protein ACRC7O_17585 [Fimbriiglobus sp.]
MPATLTEPPTPSRTVGGAGRFFAAVAAFVLIAHGCHGPDADHEPTAVPFSPTDRSR